MSVGNIKYINAEDSEMSVDGNLKAKEFQLPKIVYDEETYQLADLLSSEFPMKETDRSF